MRANASNFSLDWSPDAIIVTSVDRSILHLNPRAESLFGYQLEELSGRPLEMLVPEGLASVVAQGPRQRSVHTVACSHRDGTRFTAVVRWRPVPESAGDCLIFSIREASPSQRDGAPQGPARAVADRDLDLVEIFAHDLRKSLQAIQFITDSLVSREPESASTISDILDTISRLLEQVTNVGGFANVQPVIEECEVGLVLEELHRELDAVARHKGLALIVEESTERLATDPILFRELLHNLVSSAIRYTETGSVVMRCYSDPASLRVEITDMGIGIDRRELDGRLKTSRVASAADQPTLGLAIVRHLAERLGLSIEIESAHGKGSRFTVVAPREAQQAPPRRGNDSSVHP